MAVEALQAGPRARERQQATLDGFAAALREGRRGRPGPPDDLAYLLLGGVVALIARYVDSGRAERLPEATAALVEYLLTPYIGGEETNTVLSSLPKTG